MRILKTVGFYHGLPSQEQIDALRSLCRDEPSPDEEKILSYLEAGAICAVVPGIEMDRLTHPSSSLGAPHIQTDGAWAWPNTLSYYVRKYHVMLPEEFTTHMAANAWKCPVDVDVNDMTFEGHITL